MDHNKMLTHSNTLELAGLMHPVEEVTEGQESLETTNKTNRRQSFPIQL